MLTPAGSVLIWVVMLVVDTQVWAPWRPVVVAFPSLLHLRCQAEDAS